MAVLTSPWLPLLLLLLLLVASRGGFTAVAASPAPASPLAAISCDSAAIRIFYNGIQITATSNSEVHVPIRSSVTSEDDDDVTAKNESVISIFNYPLDQGTYNLGYPNLFFNLSSRGYTAAYLRVMLNLEFQERFNGGLPGGCRPPDVADMMTNDPNGLAASAGASVPHELGQPATATATVTTTGIGSSSSADRSAPSTGASSAPLGSAHAGVPTAVIIVSSMLEELCWCLPLLEHGGGYSERVLLDGMYVG
ncbi:hypothetical protein VOLCADRAFT_88818 [Volvox carteri f. nagariensis]|uniref:Pherophorin domain-containing protein n=1 Tax=Volvox carteri f. nagariensis TaxID=3068 RepID=D8TQ15_VOLCA|nr:uncharacterized protein VOLCADRAFT_88818 [Volvox carteri f. nagariensis]EFJ50458.1 hypothetical protein VOLCADRAFT_88818 [Volvox carteri f. nagariensis]|eukprot:XP_002948583.1 hypothetical protein VOLCADRAFT_88818 [Volvox carteri f. nagariensis]